MLPIDRKTFDEWYAAPVDTTPPDPRLAVERARPESFEEIYDLVDTAFGTKRPRELYDWLYRDHPLGVARCWVVRERATGALVASAGAWPWPLAWGERPVQATLNGDEVTAPGWRGQGVGEVNRTVFARHPWYPSGTMMAWPNEKTVARAHKVGRGHRLVGPLPRATRVLRGRHGRRVAGIAIEEVGHFDSSFDAVTERCAAWDGFWCPHEAGFLDWRYRRHPTREYVAFAALRSDALQGYAVVRVGGRRAVLMELVAPAAPDPVAGALLAAAATAAASAGAARLDVFAPPRWRHWPLLREHGFAPRDSQMYLYVRDRLGPEILDPDRWQCGPGDHDDV